MIRGHPFAAEAPGKAATWAALLRPALAVALLAAGALPVRAQAPARRYDIPAGSLAGALDRIARDADLYLLYDPAQVQALKAPALHLSGSPDQALAAALAGSGFSARRIGAGNYVLVRLPLAEKPPAPAAAVTTVPELLIVGRRALNADIPRRPDDIQPYRVLSADDVAGAPGSSTPELLRDLLPANVSPSLASQQPASSGGVISSDIDLRGLGPDQTLVLVDGRRLPSSASLINFPQSNVAGVPAAAMERVEILSGTSGGLYGPGATGGVVNIVLKHDYPGLWLEVQGGMDQRGDGQQSRVDGGFSYASPGGGTRFSLMADYGSDAGLTQGQRSFVAQLQQTRQQRTPDPSNPPYSANVNVVSADGSPLVLIRKLGGQSLGASTTNLPANSGGAGGDEAALLRAGAGSFDYQLANDGNGAAGSLTSASQTGAIVADARQAVGGRVQLFANLLFFSERGVAIGPQADPFVYLARGQVGNPFKNDIVFTAPATGTQEDTSTVEQTLRATAGLIVRLDAGWSLNGDATWGQSSYHLRVPVTFASLDGVDVFTPGSSLASALPTLAPPLWAGVRLYDRMTDYSLRAAGPLLTLPGGPMTLSLSIERRDENNPGQQADSDSVSLAVTGLRTLAVTSGFGELRAPVLGLDAPLVPLRGLELQLAARIDRDDIFEPGSTDAGAQGPASDLRAHYTTAAFTAGAKVTPAPGLTLRASFATGYLPPTPDQIVPTTLSYSPDLNDSAFTDPARTATARRDGKRTYALVQGGSPALQPEQAQTLTAGFIVQPPGLRGLSFSADYARISLSHQITDFASGDGDYFLAHEAQLPGHVIRKPLTAADAARGDTAGVITEIDATDLNVGITDVDAVDFDLAYDRDVSFGHIRFHASTSGQLSHRTRTDPFGPWYQTADYFDGPVGWKGDAGVEWRSHDLSTALNSHYVGGFHITSATADAGQNAYAVQVQGASTVPAQFYIDALFGLRTRIADGHPVAFRFAIDDLFDQMPPPVYYFFSQGYSLFGDPRGRRFVVSMSAAF